MVLPKILVKNKNNLNFNLGITLIEIILVLAIFTFIGYMAITIDFDFYFLHMFESDKAKFLSFLYRSRSQSLNNINNKKHGICVEQGASLRKVILFEGDSFDKAENMEDYDLSNSIFFDSDLEDLFCQSDKGIVFERLSAKTKKIKIGLYQKDRLFNINISDEGVIQ